MAACGPSLHKKQTTVKCVVPYISYQIFPAIWLWLISSLWSLSFYNSMLFWQFLLVQSSILTLLVYLWSLGHFLLQLEYLFPIQFGPCRSPAISLWALMCLITSASFLRLSVFFYISFHVYRPAGLDIGRFSPRYHIVQLVWSTGSYDWWWFVIYNPYANRSDNTWSRYLVY
jgi:hypothetical protein